MGDRLKSAYELAMEKLAKKDKEAPDRSTAPEKLTASQKTSIAEIRRECEAKLAEREILYKSERRGVAGDPEALQRLEEGYQRDREHLLSRREQRIREVREGGAPGTTGPREG